MFEDLHPAFRNLRHQEWKISSFGKFRQLTASQNGDLVKRRYYERVIHHKMTISQNTKAPAQQYSNKNSLNNILSQS